MSSTNTTLTTHSPEQVRDQAILQPRYWPGLVLVGLYWIVLIALRSQDLVISTVFMSSMAASALLALLITIWWLTNRSIHSRDRLFSFLAVVGGGILAYILCDPSVGGIGLVLLGVPLAISAWLLWMFLMKSRPVTIQRIGLLVVLVIVWGSFVTVRVEGVDGSNNATTSWRWSRSAEDGYLSQRAKVVETAQAEEMSAQTLDLQAGDWPDFRGPNRNGEVHGVTIATDWSSNPPKQLWRQQIGPAWSSVVIIGDHLFTQEQRGEAEVAVCLDAGTGREIWAHEDKVRFSDGQAGAGPRATPSFADNRLYTLGATGILNCLDAATGKLHWTRNIVADSGAPLPMWGFSSSPLVANGVVTVFAGGPQDKGLLAYHVESGEPAWTAATGPTSYSSAQLVSSDGASQILFLSDQGLISIAPDSGNVLWQYVAPSTGIWRVVQPRQIDDKTFLIGSEDLGLVRLELAHVDQTWAASPRWSTRAIRPAYNDFVVLGDSVYGFDEGIFCCVDVETGKRRWKGGRYGHGQALLVADQGVLVVISETGDAVCVAANPNKHEELGKFSAIKGKTWNHPVIAHGRLFVRNDEEIACYEVAPATSP